MKYGDRNQAEVIYTFYMDVLKIYADSNHLLDIAIRVVEDMSKNLA